MNKFRNIQGKYKSYKDVFLTRFLIGLMVVMPWAFAHNQYISYAQPIVVEREDVKVDSKIIDVMKRDVVSMVRYSEVNRELVHGELFYTNDPHSSIQGKCKRIGGKRNIACDSWGVMQMKIPTVQFYYKKLYSVELSEMQALIIALDEEKAMQLAEEIIFKVEGGVWEWAGANKNKAYLTKQIPLIRELEKITK